MRAAERAGARDRALVVLMLLAGLRIGESVALDVDDVTISTRKGLVVIRSGKGDAYREVVLTRSVVARNSLLLILAIVCRLALRIERRLARSATREQRGDQHAEDEEAPATWRPAN